MVRKGEEDGIDWMEKGRKERRGGERRGLEEKRKGKGKN